VGVTGIEDELHALSSTANREATGRWALN
jgi:hypothetical protein